MPKKTEYRGRFLEMINHDGWEYVQRSNATGVVCLIPETIGQELIFVEQYRPAVQSQVLEFPAGLVGDEDDQEAEIEAAKRELEEETGYRARLLKPAGSYLSSGGLTNESVSFYLASECDRVSAGGGVGSEQISVHLVKHDEISQFLGKIKHRVLIDAKLLTGLWLWYQHQADPSES